MWSEMRMQHQLTRHIRFEVGAYAQLMGLMDARDDHDGNDDSHHSYNDNYGILLGYDESSGRWEIKIENEEGLMVLSVHPSNVCVEESPAQRDESGLIIFEQNEGGFVEPQHWTYVERNERGEQEGWRPFAYDPHQPARHPPHQWKEEEEDAIYDALRRLANAVAPEGVDDEGEIYVLCEWPDD
jgi:hypothetical protein